MNSYGLVFTISSPSSSVSIYGLFPVNSSPVNVLLSPKSNFILSPIFKFTSPLFIIWLAITISLLFCANLPFFQFKI